jgi:hypothetical protein
MYFYVLKMTKIAMKDLLVRADDFNMMLLAETVQINKYLN